MPIDLIAYSKLNKVTKERDIAIILFAVVLVAGITYGVIEYKQRQKKN
jgi:hypothetical protein